MVPKGSPISVPEFYHVFMERLSSIGHPMHRGARIGIAVSGGVDSMALAFLCAGLKHYEVAERVSDFSFKAYIVNHQARKGSGVEAVRVYDRLQRMGLYALVLRLNWPAGINPSELPDFESQARRLRYPALGTACRNDWTQFLLLGHHANDQAETILMRSAFGQQGKGLRGMYGFSRIPECWGIYGVDNSGQDDYNTWRMSMFGEGGLRVPSADLQSASRERTIFESGGVAVLRPLLNFPKQRLLDTCHANGVVWEEDPTNYDLWRTPRNTVRAFLASSKLPQALREGPLLRVAQNRVKRFAEIDGWSKRLFDHCEIAVFDVRSARLVVRLVEDSFVGSLRIRDLLLARLCVAAMLARFVNMVSPIEHVSMESLHFAALSVFPELLESDNSLNPRLQPEGFTDGGVQFRRVRLPLDPHRSSIQQTNPNFVWQLTRQPYSKVLPDFRVAGAVNGAPKWSPWKLWDGRYWIRIFNPLPLPVAVRPLRPTDLSGIRSTLSPDQWNKFYESLKDAAPDNTRWTLPVIAEDNSENITSGGVLALPTLEPPCLIDISSAEGSRTLQWEIRYKKIVLDYENKMLEEKRALKTWAD